MAHRSHLGNGLFSLVLLQIILDQSWLWVQGSEETGQAWDCFRGQWRLEAPWPAEQHPTRLMTEPTLSSSQWRQLYFRIRDQENSHSLADLTALNRTASHWSVNQKAVQFQHTHIAGILLTNINNWQKCQCQYEITVTLLSVLIYFMFSTFSNFAGWLTLSLFVPLLHTSHHSSRNWIAF